MKSFVDVDKAFAGQPRKLGPLLARIDTGKGREALFEDQLPELLHRLAEDARVASITASNAIEGVIVEDERAEQLAEGARRFRNRNEREFAGYRDATDELMRLESYAPLTVPYVLYLHRLLFAHSGGRGGHLKSDPNLIVSYGDGRRQVVFEPTAPEQTEFQLSELLTRYQEAKEGQIAHPLVLIGALIVDFLAIHPVADGNGRLARLLTTHELLAEGYRVARYASIEQRIYESKNAYYAALHASQRGWHESNHDIWPWITYLAEILAAAYDDFEASIAAAKPATGNKQERVREHILEYAPESFRRRDVARALPGISDATIRLVLAELRDEGSIESEGSGPGARWRRLPPQGRRRSLRSM
ncbi:MAG TPA: Fic family protein [Solirubrobacterales bacterium]|nr:Fic family protein [Solirubrobacterales bacterium]